MAPPGEGLPPATPLAPSVEKAYYRKCIELKRRLNDVEVANDELKIRRLRLDRGIMKMRLERAFLLDELRKRMDYNVEGSEASGDEGMATPPTDRPHRDKRRRPETSSSSRPAAQQSSTTVPSQPNTHPPAPAPAQVPSQAGREHVPANATETDNNLPPYVPSQEAPQRTTPASYPSQPPPASSPYHARAGSGASDRQVNGSEAPVNRTAGAVGEALNAGPTIREAANGDRKIVSPTSAEDANVESEQNGAAGGIASANS